MEPVESLRFRTQALKHIQTKREGNIIETMVASSNETAEEDPLSPAARLFHEPNFNVYIIAIVGIKNQINPDAFKAELVHTLLRHPRFSSLQVVDEKMGIKEMKWVRTKVDLEKQVIIPHIDPNIDSPDKFMEDYISNLSKTSIDTSKPMWELHLLNLKTSDAEAVAVFRIHHSLGDGMSLMSALLACTRKISDPKAPPTIPTSKISKRTHYSGGIWSIFRLVWNTMIDVLMFIATAFFLKDTKTPLRGPPDVGSTPRRFVHRSLSLDDIKLVKNAMNATINDVVMGVAQAGLSRYLNRKYGEGKKDKGASEKKNNLPDNIRLRATLLYNLRPSPGIHALAEMMAKETLAKWGNAIGSILLPFTISLRDDPLDYVRNAKATIDRKKHSYEAICTFYITNLIFKLFGIKAASFIYHRVPSHTTICFSNVVGPLEEICFSGHEVAYLAPSCYGQPHALMIHFQSYFNKMTFVLSADEDTVPNPHQLCDDLEESLKLIKDAVLEKGLVKEDVLARG